MMTSESGDIHHWSYAKIASKLSDTQWYALFAVASPHGYLSSVAIHAHTRASLQRLRLIEEQEGRPAITERGLAVLDAGRRP